MTAKAGVVAALLWVLGVGTRFAFHLDAVYGGGPAIGRFSVAHSITSARAWVAALILMAMGEALARTWRCRRYRWQASSPRRPDCHWQV